MIRLVGSLVVLSMVIAMIGCVSNSDIGVVNIDQPQIGKTTRRQVVELWGNPDAINGDIWVWKDWRQIGGKGKVGYMGVGFTVSNLQMGMVECHLTFDESGLLREKKFVESMPGGAQWELFPW